jgi:hypothetical protein
VIIIYIPRDSTSFSVLVNDDITKFRLASKYANALLNRSKFSLDMNRQLGDEVNFKKLSDELLYTIFGMAGGWKCFINFGFICRGTYNIVSEFCSKNENIYKFIFDTVNSSIPSGIVTNTKLLCRSLTNERILELIEYNQEVKNLMEILFGKIPEPKVKSISISFDSEENNKYKLSYTSEEMNEKICLVKSTLLSLFLRDESM